MLTTHGRNEQSFTSKAKFICDNDINAIMRKMDKDDDELISFPDFFTTLLPYFIYGDKVDMRMTHDMMLSARFKDTLNYIDARNSQVGKKENRATSAGAAQKKIRK